MSRGSYEKLSIRDSARSLKRYGSTNRHSVPKTDNFIKHVVNSTDTLQGIALKYEVTMEQIRRANRLFASDSIFLRDCLLIPTNEPDLVSVTSEPATPTSSDIPGSSSRTDLDDLMAQQMEVEPNNFLLKIDASIASTKEIVQKAHRNSQYVCDSDDFASTVRQPTISRMKQSVNNNASDHLQTVVISNQHGNKVKTSMKRFEQQQDELFEL